MVDMVAHAITAASGACSLGSSGRRREMAGRVLMVLMVQVALCEQFRRDPSSLIDRLSHGMKFATDFLGSESVATKVAEFVVRAFQADKPPLKRPPIDAYADHSSEESSAYENQPNSNVHDAPNPLAPLKYLVRLFGLQPSQISAVAVNALVFVAQMISTFLSGKNRPSRPYRAEDPKEWIMNKNSRRLQDLLSQAKNESLFGNIEQIIDEQASDEDTSCIRLLVCKITPFVHKMQEAVFGKEPESHKAEKLRGAAIMYRHLPSPDEINARSDICEQRHANCHLNE